MLTRPDGTVITTAQIRELRGTSGTAPAQSIMTPCAARPDMDGHFYLRDGERVCCWCGVAREWHGKDAVASKRHEALPAKSPVDPFPAGTSGLPAALGSFGTGRR